MTQRMAGERAPAAGAGDRRARAVRAIVFMNRLFEYECRELGLSLGQYRLLLYLRHGPVRAGELAVHASMTRPALSILINTLQKQGLIERSTVHADRRGVRLELTRKGQAAVARAEERFGRVFDEATEGCDRDRLVLALTELTRQLTHDIKARVRPDAFDSDEG
jgi:DNA-binding MarR family transcriptional regulator